MQSTNYPDITHVYFLYNVLLSPSSDLPSMTLRTWESVSPRPSIKDVLVMDVGLYCLAWDSTLNDCW